DRLAKPRLHRIGAGRRGLEQWTPTLDRKTVTPGQGEVGSGEMELRQRLPDRPPRRGAGPPDPHAVEKGDDGGRTPGEPAQRFAAAAAHRLRTVEPPSREMLYQIEEERQVAFRHTLLIKREDEIALGRVEQEIRILDPFRNALVGREGAEIVAGKELLKLLVGDIG